MHPRKVCILPIGLADDLVVIAELRHDFISSAFLKQQQILIVLTVEFSLIIDSGLLSPILFDQQIAYSSIIVIPWCSQTENREFSILKSSI